MALLLSITPVQLAGECAAISCQQQPGYDCLSAYGARQAAEHLGIPLYAPPRWDWPAVDRAVWDGLVLFSYPWAEPDWTPDSLSHAFYCLGDKWLPLAGSPGGGVRMLHCWDSGNPDGTWWDVRLLQRTWTGWAVTR